MAKSEHENSISAEQKLVIRDEVERRLTHLPAETLKIIQSEVASRVADRERFYIGIGGLLAVVLVVATGITWNNLRERTKEIIQRTSDVQSLESNVLSRFNEITNMYVAALDKYHELTNRIHELEGIDNLVTEQQLQKAFEQVTTLKFQAGDALFTATTAAAESGDANAYDRLQLWAKDRSNPLASQASRAISDLQSRQTGPFYKPYAHDVTVQWDFNSGFEAAKSVYMSSQPEGRLSIIETIAKRTNYSRSEKMNFLVQAALTDITIAGRRLAVDLINEEAKTKFFVFQPDEIADWWRTNKIKYNPQSK